MIELKFKKMVKEEYVVGDIDICELLDFIIKIEKNIEDVEFKNTCYMYKSLSWKIANIENMFSSFEYEFKGLIEKYRDYPEQTNAFVCKVIGMELKIIEFYIGRPKTEYALNEWYKNHSFKYLIKEKNVTNKYNKNIKKEIELLKQIAILEKELKELRGN
jgi:hypothetical protein